MFELIKAGGWVMWPLILCSIAALAIIGERLWTLQKKSVIPPELLNQVRQWLERKELERGLALYGTGEKAVLRIAADLGISRATVYRRLHHYGLMPVSD